MASDLYLRSFRPSVLSKILIYAKIPGSSIRWHYCEVLITHCLMEAKQYFSKQKELFFFSCSLYLTTAKLFTRMYTDRSWFAWWEASERCQHTDSSCLTLTHAECTQSGNRCYPLRLFLNRHLEGAGLVTKTSVYTLQSRPSGAFQEKVC